MAERYAFRHVHSITGTFVLICVAMLLIMLFLAGRYQRWFVRQAHYVILLPEEGLFGVREGADVEILGTVVGTVQSIDVADDDSMRADIAVRSDFARFVRVGSRAIIKRKLALAGDAFVEITRGDRITPLDEGSEIRAEADRAILEVLTEVVQQIRTEVLPVIHEIRLAASEYRQLAAEMRDPDGDLRGLLDTVNSVAALADRGEGVIARLLRDNTWADQVDGTLHTVNQTMDQVRRTVEQVQNGVAETSRIAAVVSQEMMRVPEMSAQGMRMLAETEAILKDVRAATARLPAILDAIHDETKALPGLVLQTQQTMREIERLMEGLQRHWLVRDFVEQDTLEGRIAPTRLQGAGGR